MQGYHMIRNKNKNKKRNKELYDLTTNKIDIAIGDTILLINKTGHNLAL